MKILQVGSDSIHIKLFVKAMREHRVESLLLSEEPIEGFASEQFSFRSSNPLHWYINYRKLKHYLAQLKPSVVHIHQVNRLAVFVILACRKLQIKVLTTTWGSDVLLVPQRNAFNRFLVSYALKNSDIITADAETMIEAIKPLSAPLKKEIVYLQYGIDPVLPVVKEKMIFSNRLHKPLYQIEKIISDFIEFYKSHPDWKLVVGGAGETTNQLKKMVDDAGINKVVEFAGWLNASQNANYYSRASIYVSIPESDGMSVSVLEALSAECIPVCSDIDVTNSWLNDGVNGVIRKTTKNPFEEALTINVDHCTKQNREWVSSFAYRSATIPRFIAIYKKLLA